MGEYAYARTVTSVPGGGRAFRYSEITVVTGVFQSEEPCLPAPTEEVIEQLCRSPQGAALVITLYMAVILILLFNKMRKTENISCILHHYCYAVIC